MFPYFASKFLAILVATERNRLQSKCLEPTTEMNIFFC